MNIPDELSVVMPNYNGEALLQEYLPPLIAALESWGGNWELLIVDDCSSDNSTSLLKNEFSLAKVLVNERNCGFSYTCNRGMSAAKYRYALCINTDVLVEDGFIAPLLKHFKDDDLFAVTPNILASSEGKNQGIVSGLWGKGFLKGGFAGLDQKSACRENFYAVGACVVYDLQKFRALGGYSELYSPYLFEDVDIAYRAWKRGWKSLYEPTATVHHLSSATISKEGKRRKRQIYFRNRFLFHWVNLTAPDMLAIHCMRVFIRLLTSFLWGDFIYYASFWGALTRWRKVVALRSEEQKHHVVGDRQILSRTA